MNPTKQRLIRLIALAGIVAIFTGVWSLAGYKPRLRLDNRALAPLAFTPNGDVLAAGTLVQDGLLSKPESPVRFLNSTNGADAEPPLTTSVATEVGKLRIGRAIIRAEFSPDGRLLAVLQQHHDIKLLHELELVVFSRQSRERIVNIPVPYHTNAADNSSTMPRSFFSPDSKWLLWVDYPFPERLVHVWDLASGKEAYTLPNVCYPVVSPDSAMIATTQFWRTRDKEPFAIQIWDIRSGALRQTLPLHGTSEGWSPWPSFSPDSRLLAVNSRDDNGKQTAEVFETATWKRMFFQQGAWSPHLLSDAKTLVAVKNRDVQLWDTEKWKLKGKYEFKLGLHWDNGQEITPEPVAIPNKPMVIVADYYPTVTVPLFRGLANTFGLNAFGSQHLTFIDGTSGRRQSVVLHHDSLVSGAIFAPDGSKAAFGSISGSLSLWDIPPRKSLTPLLRAIAVAVVGFALVYKLIRRRTVKE
ncbi:MAG: WD40 repeat domain-containing protein [Pirellula sp.]